MLVHVQLRVISTERRTFAVYYYKQDLESWSLRTCSVSCAPPSEFTEAVSCSFAAACCHINLRTGSSITLCSPNSTIADHLLSQTHTSCLFSIPDPEASTFLVNSLDSSAPELTPTSLPKGPSLCQTRPGRADPGQAVGLGKVGRRTESG